MFTAILNILYCIFFSLPENTLIDLTDSPVKGKNTVKASPVVIEDSPVKKKVKKLDADYKFLNGYAQKPVLFFREVPVHQSYCLITF